MWSVWSRTIAFVLFLCCALGATAQLSNDIITPKNNSPYSRFGLGDIFDLPFASAAGMAGLSAANQESFHINLLNPASLAYLQATAFEVGIYARYANLSEGNSSAGIWSGNLNYLALAFPIKNPINRVLDRDQTPFGWGMNLALVPYSLVGYDIETEGTPVQAGTVTNSLKGNGGTYRLMWGNGVRYGGFAFGANLGYQFGKITNSRRVVFDSLRAAYLSEFLDEFSVSGFYWSFGAQYTYEFIEQKKEEDANTKRRMTIGIYGNPASSFETNSSTLNYRTNFDYGEIDTILSVSDIIQSGTMPVEWGAGVMYEKQNRYKFGFEYTAANWSNYVNEAKPEALVNSYRIAIGGQITPDYISYNNYFKRVRYRFGAFYSTDPRTIDGSQLREFGITFGAGFPIILPRQQTSFINLAFELGQFGLEEALQETYFKMTLGFTLNDNTWFFKRKFN